MMQVYSESKRGPIKFFLIKQCFFLTNKTNQTSGMYAKRTKINNNKLFKYGIKMKTDS